jgi:hypothetical protein
LIGAGVLLFIVLIHECGRWSARKFNQAKHATVLSLRVPAAVRMPKLTLPKPIGTTRKV